MHRLPRRDRPFRYALLDLRIPDDGPAQALGPAGVTLQAVRPQALRELRVDALGVDPQLAHHALQLLPIRIAGQAKAVECRVGDVLG